MFLAIQFPFADLRPFLPSGTGRLSVPSFPLPEPGKEFVRSVGWVERRRRGGIPGWEGEELYCRARAAIRFENRLGRRSIGSPGIDLRPACAFRRFHSDGRMGRVELGLRLSGRQGGVRSIRPENGLAVLQDCLELGVRVAAASGREAQMPLYRVADPLARHLLRSSTRHQGGALLSVQSWWLAAGEPVLLLESLPGELDGPPLPMRKIDLDGDTEVRLSHGRLQHEGNAFGLWWLEAPPTAPNRDLLRRLRIHLFRLHAEREVLKGVLRALGRGRLNIEPETPATDELQDYLNTAIRLLDRKVRYGLDQSALLDSALRFTDYVSPGERTTLLTELEKARTNIYRKVARFTEARSREAGTTNVFVERQIVERQIHFGGDVTVGGDFNVVTAEKIENSFNKAAAADHLPDELQTSLQELSKQVAEMVKHLPEDRAEEAARDLETLTDEAASGKPRRKWYELSAEGLMDAAKAVGKVAEPVVATVTKILPLLAALVV